MNRERISVDLQLENLGSYETGFQIVALNAKGQVDPPWILYLAIYPEPNPTH